MEEYGFPPVFPDEEEQVEVKEEPKEFKIENKAKGKRSKAVAKQGLGSLLLFAFSVFVLKKQVHSDNDASGIDILGCFGTIRRTF